MSEKQTCQEERYTKNVRRKRKGEQKKKKEKKKHNESERV